MTLSMARPHRHPDTKIFWFRKVVPLDLRALVGKREEKCSLNTRDLNEAKARHAQKHAEVLARWAALRRGPTTISERAAHDIGDELYKRYLALHSDNPSRHGWNTSQGLFFEQTDWEQVLLVPPPLTPLRASPAEERHRLMTFCLSEVEQYLAREGLSVDDQSKRNLLRAAGRAFQRASFTLADYARGNYPESVAGTKTLNEAAQQADGEAITFDKLFEAWQKEKKPAAKTCYAWQRTLAKLKAFVGHDDAARLTADHLLRWKAAMVDEGLSAKTIRDGKLAPVRAILQWGYDNRHLSENPAARIPIDVRKRAGERKRGFSDVEARTILLAARGQADPALRWLPWLCAYSGARISEVSQLRREDIEKIEDVWCMRLTADAGSLKNAHSERVVPLHSALLDEGFLHFVERQSLGPVFSNVIPDRFASRGGTTSKAVCRWVRATLSLTDKRLQPNHGWRHRFVTLGRDYGLDPDIRNAITSHARRSVAEAYGEFRPATLQRELEKIPRLILAIDENCDTEQAGT